MSATERLRAMLDERGVEWRDDSSIYGTRRTVWTADGVTYVAAEVSGRLKVSGYLTPEQAVEATLGMGTCRAVSMRERDKRPYLYDELVCSECGCQLAHELEHVWQRFCPNCGRKVVDA